jgi:hypothetical protein
MCFSQLEPVEPTCTKTTQVETGAGRIHVRYVRLRSVRRLGMVERSQEDMIAESDEGETLFWGGPIGLGMFLAGLGVFLAGLGVFLWSLA